MKLGTVYTNTRHHYSPAATLGGVKLSGYGRGRGIESLENYTPLKTIWTDLYE
ncbi:MAG: aldehyde dehydrogenase family protein [Ferruginibacter sp.]|nr:aldehyde dehydrogenase family protein [Ferruginibacter sp.]